MLLLDNNVHVTDVKGFEFDWSRVSRVDVEIISFDEGSLGSDLYRLCQVELRRKRSTII